MAYLSVSAVRQRIAAAVEALPGWTQSRYAHPLFGSDTKNLAPHSFAVGVAESVLHEADGRQVTAEGCLWETAVDVAFLHNLRLDAQVQDWDAMLDAEAALIVAVVGISRRDLHILQAGASREVLGDGTYALSTVRFRAIHRIQLV